MTSLNDQYPHSRHYWVTHPASSCHWFLGGRIIVRYTAPLAAHAVTEIVKLPRIERSRFSLDLAVRDCHRVLFASLSVKPLQLILLAQIANGALLPVIAIFILWVSNDKKLLAERSSNSLQNLLGCLVVGITLVLGSRSISLALGWL